MSDLLYLRLITSANAIYKRASINNGTHSFITKDEFKVLKEFGLIVPVISGGFIKAPSHNEGGIKLLWPDNDRYLICSELEGYEFIMTPNITKIAENELKQINEVYLSSKPTLFDPYPIPSNVTIIDGSNTLINGAEFPRFLISSGQPQFIINKFSTKEFYDILEGLNQSDI